MGGSDEDREAVAAQHEAYLVANSKFDWDHLMSVYSESSWATYFNLNGHTYDGRDHWIKLWKYYITQQETGYWRPFDMKGVISGDLATVWCHRNTQSTWFGGDDPMSPRREGKPFISRSTMIFCRQDGDWRCVHVHFSESRSEEPRPGGI
ncbi:YybH family protein [Chelatococcus reniformis]|uniref:YybH family protein n=1 Tax=Chelatococcus reniformis TaxID=1494448 RepID=UPI00166CF91B|nr:nuclear transport factor 2 family protein [Chelatococcus reniformis]